jgi:hypothetical protein
MKKIRRTIAIVTLSLTLLTQLSLADSLELADGTLLEGDFVGSSNGIVMFNTGDSIEAFPENQAEGIFLSKGVATAQAAATGPDPSTITAPAGTRIVIRMADSVDSKRHKRAKGSSSLAMEFTDIMINDQLYPIATQGLAAQTGGEGKRTLGRTARAAAIGGLVDGSSGAKTGAKVGAGASILTGGRHH